MFARPWLLGASARDGRCVDGHTDLWLSRWTAHLDGSGHRWVQWNPSCEVVLGAAWTRWLLLLQLEIQAASWCGH